MLTQVLVEKIRTFNSYYGERSVVVMRSDDYTEPIVTFVNAFGKFISQVKEGDRIELDCKIKDHRSYEGEMQMLVSWCKVVRHIQ